METLTYFKAIVLGIVQGLGEFLPISSSGHLALLENFFDIKESSILLFTVMLHIGTLVSVFAVYWKDIIRLIFELCYVVQDVFKKKGLRINANATRRMGFMIIVATIPTAIIGFAFDDLFEGLYSSITSVGVGLVFTGTILWIAEKMGTGDKHIFEMNFTNAVVVGLMQGIAIAPGISRSGSTLFGGLISRIDKEFAVKFAFLISIPSILGSFVLEFPKALKSGEAIFTGPVIVGMIVAAISGFLAIKVMIKIVSDKKLSIFSFYTWALGACVIIYSLVR